ncbi:MULTISPECIES: enediyne antibiotic chromoprotein [Streptomyces]|uniref:Enediyne antibiotic chromoprotein n=1 Tax=Streptomyces luteosporeus TaxID=173856 RepID=A0ABN3TTS8_9ACTN
MFVRTKRTAAVAAAGAAALTLAVGLGTSASAEPPKATVTPSSGLGDGGVVRVAATGLKAGNGYDVGQCAWVASGALACNMAVFTHVSAGADGSLHTSVKVHKKFNGVSYGGARWGVIDCAVTQCLVGMGDATGNGPAAVPISFR